MIRLSRSLARRVDRLARRAHAFHRWAHHPLCERYAAEVVRVGRRRRFCRGCLLALGGAMAGAAAGLVLPSPGAPVLLGSAGLLLAAAPSAVRARAASGWRGRKLATRFAPALLAGALGAQALAAPGPASIAAGLAGLAAVAWAIRRYRLRGPDRAACAGCPAGPPGAACPGLAPLYLRERAFRRLAGRWIAAEAAARTRRGGAAWIPGLP